MPTEKCLLKIGGMTCSSCAETVKSVLEKEGAKNIWVDFTMNEAVFEKPEDVSVDKFIRALRSAGYFVNDNEEENTFVHHRKVRNLFVITLGLTIPLLLSMFLKNSFLHRLEIQLLLSFPVLLIGFFHFGHSALQSLLLKRPNMEVLILTGALASFIYSIAGWLMHHSYQYMFFETTATIITFMLLGNVIENYSVAKTTLEIKKMQKSMEVNEVTIRYSINGETRYEVLSVDLVLEGDIILIREGEQVPLDARIESGTAEIDESLITGESKLVLKKTGDEIIAGSKVIYGSVEAKIIRKKNETVLAQIIEIVRKTQREKTELQKLGDKISAVFVPVVIIFSIFTFFLNYFIDKTISESMLRSVAVLVIACPCAMGLAAPTAVAVALGVAARQKILFRKATAFEALTKSNIFVFDKTGTLTTGKLIVEKMDIFTPHISKEKILSLVNAAEIHSLHPAARALRDYCKQHNAREALISDVKEEKGVGIFFRENEDATETHYALGSFRILTDSNIKQNEYDIYLTRNGVCLAGFKLKDEIRPDAIQVIQHLLNEGKKVCLLSGDKREKCLITAKECGIPLENVFYEKLPHEKLEIIQDFKKQGFVCMVGDGLNDAPSLAMANVSVSFNHSPALTIDSADIIIAHEEVLSRLRKAICISKKTVQKIKQNYFWAFFYNLLAIPVAAMGYLHPIMASLSMAFSDVIVVGNSLRIYKLKH